MISRRSLGTIESAFCDRLFPASGNISGAVFFEPLPVLGNLSNHSTHVRRVVAVVHLSTEASLCSNASSSPHSAHVLLTFKGPTVSPDANHKPEVKTRLREVDDGVLVAVDATVYSRNAEGVGIKELLNEQGSKLRVQRIVVPLSVWAKFLLILFGLSLGFNGMPPIVTWGRSGRLGDDVTAICRGVRITVTPSWQASLLIQACALSGAARTTEEV